MLKSFTGERRLEEMLEEIVYRSVTYVYEKPSITAEDIDLIEKVIDLSWTLDHMNIKPTV